MTLTEECGLNNLAVLVAGAVDEKTRFWRLPSGDVVRLQAGEVGEWRDDVRGIRFANAQDVKDADGR